MAQDNNNPDVDVVEFAPVDNAKEMTSALVIITTVLLVLAFLVMHGALNHHFKVGFFA